MLIVALTALAAAAAQCLPVSGDRILARDMARAVPAFAGMAPELALGYAPAPGARRVYGAAELARLERRYALAVEPGGEACFMRPVETLTEGRVAEALRAALPAAHIELVEFSRQPVPPGELRFAGSGLPTDPHAVLLWRGVVAAPGQPDFPVWAKVRIAVSGRRAISSEALAAGRPIERAQLREENYQGPPGFADLSQVVGWVPRRPIPAGIPLERQWLDPPVDVVRGELVRVEILSGRARVFLEAEAQSSGRRGDVIAVRNPGNGKILRATVADRRRVVVAAGQDALRLEGGSR